MRATEIVRPITSRNVGTPCERFVIGELRKVGLKAKKISKGPDILVNYNDKDILIEIKCSLKKAESFESQGLKISHTGYGAGVRPNQLKKTNILVFFAIDSIQDSIKVAIVPWKSSQIRKVKFSGGEQYAIVIPLDYASIQKETIHQQIDPDRVFRLTEMEREIQRQIVNKEGANIKNQMQKLLKMIKSQS